MKYAFGEELGEPTCPYIKRWVLDFGLFALRLHHWYKSDDKRAPHDHPWWFITLVLKGSYEDWYYEVPNIDNKKIDRLKAGSIRYRPSKHVHSVSVKEGGCWTFIISGKQVKKWGFWIRRKDGTPRWRKSTQYFYEYGNHPCDEL